MSCTPFVDIRREDLDSAGLESSHIFRLNYLAQRDGFAQDWTMGEWSYKHSAFVCKSLHELLGDYVRLKLLTAEESRLLADEMHDRAVERLSSAMGQGAERQNEYAMIWTFEKLVEQQEHRLAEQVFSTMWRDEQLQLNNEIAQYYRYDLADVGAAQSRSPGVMLKEYWRRLAEATGKLVSEHCY